MNHILREIKLSKLTDIPMGDEATKLVKFWDKLWNDMKIKIDPIKGEIRCWKDDYDYYYFRQDNRDDYFWCDHTKVWSFFRDELKLNIIETKEVIQSMMGEILNHKVNTPMMGWVTSVDMMGETLNHKVNTPLYKHFTTTNG